MQIELYNHLTTVFKMIYQIKFYFDFKRSGSGAFYFHIIAMQELVYVFEFHAEQTMQNKL